MNSSLFPEDKIFPLKHTTGILSSQLIRKFILAKYITSKEPIEESQIQPASLDLRVGEKAFEIEASFLPGKGKKVEKVLKSLVKKEINLKKKAKLEKKKVYLIETQEILNLPQEIWGKVNPKSTIGRLDIFVRSLVDGGEEFNFIPSGFKGKIYLELSPQSFNILLEKEERLAQLRLNRGKPPSPDKTLHQLYLEDMLLFQDELSIIDPKIKQGLLISVNLKPINNSKIIGFISKETEEPIDLAKVNFYPLEKFWQPIEAQEALVLKPQKFYILSSKEKVRVPPNFAAEMFPYEPQIGEFRAHYAGFFDPGFGFGERGEVKGARAVLEIRAHNLPFLIKDGQLIGKLRYERLLAYPDKIYSNNIGSSYQGQELKLSKQFKNEF